MKKGYEYDDNIYEESDGGTPYKVYFTKEDADKASIDLEIEMLKDTDISNYAYDISNITSKSSSEVKLFLESLIEKYGRPEPKSKWDRLGEYQLNPKASFEESKEFMSMISIRFYEVIEVEVDKGSRRDYQIDEILI